MAAKVELINNPYEQRLKILINGEAVSVYSNLEKYIDEPFEYWCDRILDSIYEECNRGDFHLHFSSRKEEMKIMEKIACQHRHCIQYSSGALERSASLLERIKQLNGIIRKLRSTGYRTFANKVVFVIPESLRKLEEDLYGLEVKNSFCQIQSEVVYYQDYLRKQADADTCILLSDEIEIEQCMQRLNIFRGFGITLGDKNAFLTKKGEMFLYSANEASLFEVIFECLLFQPLLNMFRSCINTLSMELKKQYSEEIEELLSIEMKVIPVPEKTEIEVGRSSRIKFVTDIDGYEIKSTQLHYSYSEKGIIRCNGILVEGLRPGKSVLNIFKEGEQIPCAKVDYTVVLRNRIKELSLEEDSVIIGEGDRIRLNLSYFPADADNADKIEWISENENIAIVDHYGNVTGKSAGKCLLRCFAEQVSTVCQCNVKPHLEKIIVEETEIVMLYGNQKELRILLKPENSIDDQIVVSSMDMQIVNVVGRTMKAVGIGDTRIILQNEEETVRTEISVTVMTEKEYKKYQKKKNQNVSQKNEKQGWLSKLFG